MDISDFCIMTPYTLVSWTRVSDIEREHLIMFVCTYKLQNGFDVFPTVHHSIGYFFFIEPTLMHTSI